MSKKRLRFDVGQMRHPISFYRAVYVDDGYGGGQNTWQFVAGEKSKKEIKNRTQLRQEGAGFDFYQVWEFILRKNPNYDILKDMIVYADNALYVIRGVSPLETNPNYVVVITETIHDTLHELWDVINAQPYNENKDLIIKII